MMGKPQYEHRLLKDGFLATVADGQTPGVQASCWPEDLESWLWRCFYILATGTCNTLAVLGEKKLLFLPFFLSLQIQTCRCSETKHLPISEFRGKIVSRFSTCFHSAVLFYHPFYQHIMMCLRCMLLLPCSGLPRGYIACQWCFILMLSSEIVFKTLQAAEKQLFPSLSPA